MNNFSLLEDNCRHIERLSEKKSWSKLYEDRAAELNEERLLKAEIPPERRNLVKAIAAGAIIAKKMGKKVRQRLRNKNYSCRNTIENLKEPAQPGNYDAISGTALICDICGVIVLHDSISCLTCNTSVHRLCAGHVTKMEQEMQSKSLDIDGFDSFIEEGDEESNSEDEDGSEQENDSENDSDEEDNNTKSQKTKKHEHQQMNATLSVNARLDYHESVGVDDFQCRHCREDIDDDGDFYHRMMIKAEAERRFVCTPLCLPASPSLLNHH